MALKEKRQHSSELVPFSYYKCLIPDFFSCVPLHWHGEFEINYILEGSAEFLCGEERFTSEKGDIIIIPPNMLHAIYTLENCVQRYDTIVFSADMLGASANDRCTAELIQPLVNNHSGINMHITVNHPYYNEIKTTAENIFSCAKGNSCQLDMLLKSELLRLFWLLENNGDIYRKSDSNSDFIGAIRPAVEYINDNFNVDITTIRLIDSLYDYLDNHNYSKDIINYKNKRVMVNSFIYDLIQLLDNSTIDITMEELLDNKLVDMEEK